MTAASGRIVSETFPNGQTTTTSYSLTIFSDRALQRISHIQRSTLVSEFLYGRDIPTGRITTWSQQPGAQAPDFYTSATTPLISCLSTAVTNAGVLATTSPTATTRPAIA